MDPLALAAVVGLVFAGKRLSSNKDSDAAPVTTVPQTRIFKQRDFDVSRPFAQQDSQMQQAIQFPDGGRNFQGFTVQPKREVAAFGDINSETNSRPYGQPVYDLYNRQNVTNKMNNLAPIERMNVGPGLGVDPNVAATGGFQQFFRVLPNNINEERLTTLEGRAGPSDAFVKNGGTVIGDITHQAKDTKAWYRSPAQNQGQGQGGALTGAEARPDHIKTRRTTIRQETGMREDTLDMGPAQYSVYQPYASGSDAYTDKALPRCTGNRVNPDRAGNGQKMNVRADPIGAVGGMTNLRTESVAFPVQAGDAGRFQQYIQNDYDKFNEHKSKENPYVKNLDIAIQQLDKNEFAARPLSGV
jgi:hypothetical protein